MNWHDPSNEMNSEFSQLAQLKRDERQKELSWEKIQKRIHRAQPTQWIQQLYVPLLTALVVILIATGVWMALVNDINPNPKGTEEPDQETLLPFQHETPPKEESTEEDILEDDFSDEMGLMPVTDKASLEVVARFGIGRGETEFGMGWSGPLSFYVRDDTFYVLDPADKVVLQKKDGLVTSFPAGLSHCGWARLQDLYVSPENDIYIFNNASACRSVSRYDESGNYYEEDYISIPYDVNHIEGFGIGPDGELVLVGRDSGAYSFQTQQWIEGQYFLESPLSQKIRTGSSDDLTGIINIDDAFRLEIPYDHSFGELLLIDATDEELIIKKTEMVANNNETVAESYILSIGLDGEIRGGARIPTETMTFIPDHMIRVDGRNIYLLSVEIDAVYVYRVQLGKEFESIPYEDNSISYEDNSIPNQAFSLLTELEQLKINRATPKTLMDLYFNGINESNPLLSLATLHPDLIDHEQSLESAKGSFMGYKATNILIKGNSEKNIQINISREYHLIVEFEITDLQEGTGWAAGDGKQMRFVKFIKTKEDKWAIRALATSP